MDWIGSSKGSLARMPLLWLPFSLKKSGTMRVDAVDLRVIDEAKDDLLLRGRARSLF